MITFLLISYAFQSKTLSKIIFTNRYISCNSCVPSLTSCCINCLVDNVLIAGFRHEFKGKRRYANMASRDGVTYMMMERSESVITVSDASMLVTAAAPSRAKMGYRFLCDLYTLWD